MKQAMIFAAGLGTRLRPLTDSIPKALVSVGGRTLVDLLIDKLQVAGYERLVVNVHHHAVQLESHLRIFHPDVLISDERQMLLDTGGGLRHAQDLFDSDSPILLHNVDILDNVDYEWFARQHQGDEDAVLLVSRRKTSRYLLFDSAMRLMGWKNVKTGEVKSPFPWLREADFTLDDSLRVIMLNGQRSMVNGQLHAFAFSGIHSFSPRLFRLMERFDEKFSIVDFYLSTCHRARIFGCVKDDLHLLDVGKPEALQQAENFI